MSSLPDSSSSSVSLSMPARLSSMLLLPRSPASGHTHESRYNQCSGSEMIYSGSSYEILAFRMRILPIKINTKEESINYLFAIFYFTLQSP